MVDDEVKQGQEETRTPWTHSVNCNYRHAHIHTHTHTERETHTQTHITRTYREKHILHAHAPTHCYRLYLPCKACRKLYRDSYSLEFLHSASQFLNEKIQYILTRSSSSKKNEAVVVVVVDVVVGGWEVSG